MGSHTSSPTSANEVRAVLDGVRRIVQSLREASRGTEKKLGLSAAQLFVLLKLSGERALSINELAAATLTHQSSVSVVVARLVEAGMVVRARSDTDARRVEIALTRKGRALLTRAPEAAQERLIAAITGLPPARRKALAEGLALLANAIDTDPKRPRSPRMFFEEEKESQSIHVRRSRPKRA